MNDQAWFAVQRVFEDTYLIGEPMHVNSYLVIGSERAVLVDSGLGVENIRHAVEALTDRPILVVNTHHHFDHVGGNAWFDEIAIHREGEALLRKGPSPDLLRRYWSGFSDYFAEFQVFRAMDAALFQVLAPEMQMRALPSGLDVDELHFMPSIASSLLDDGEVIDLGDRRLTVLHTPGHSRDSICLHEEASQTLFTGDTVDTGPIYAHFAESSIDDFALSTRRLAGLEHIETVFSAHGARYRSYADILGRVADAFQEVRNGSVDLDKTFDCFDEQVMHAVFDDFSIVVPRTTASDGAGSTRLAGEPSTDRTCHVGSGPDPR